MILDSCFHMNIGQDAAKLGMQYNPYAQASARTHATLTLTWKIRIAGFVIGFSGLGRIMVIYL
jgi:hypothetical protein